MKMIYWNMRGLRGWGKISEVSKWVRTHRVGFIGLIETMCSNYRAQEVSRIWGYDDFDWAAIEVQGRSGGILYIWDRNFMSDTSIIKGEGWIWIKGIVQELQMEGIVGVAYGYHDAVDKRRMWKELVDKRLELNIPILMMGDFNEIRKPQERKGCISTTRNMEEFEEWISDMGLVELPMIGRKFTWRRGGQCNKLDRILTNPQWIQSCNTL